MRREIVSVIVFALLLVGMSTRVSNFQPANAGGTIYIRADGSVDPSTAQIYRRGNAYIFTDSIHDSIVVERDDIVIDGSGYAVEGTGEGKGIHLSDRRNVTIKNTEIKVFFVGILLEKSFTCNVSGNKILLCHDAIMVVSSSNNIISENNMTANDGDGIRLYYSSKYNVIHGNNITANKYDSITLSESSNNSIYGNNLENSWFAILLFRSSDNYICHNNFVNNTCQACTHMGSVNVWDEGYPSSGNYWSDYNSTDLFGGPFQNVTGSDGIGDTPYIIDENNKDRYPLTNPWVSTMHVDLNSDGMVNIQDLYIIARAYGSHGQDVPNVGDRSSENWNSVADLNKDGWINIADLYIVARDCGRMM